MEVQGIIYRACLKDDNRSYIGQTICSLKKRIREHKCLGGKPRYYFQRAIKKYGFDSFIWEILETCSTLDELNLAEEKWINHFDSIQNGFNIKNGGNNHSMSEAAKKELSENRIGDKNPMFNKASPIRGKSQSNSPNTQFKKGSIPWNTGKKSFYKRINFAQAQEIRKLHKENVVSTRFICDKFNLSYQSVSDIINNISWKFDKQKKNELLKENILKEFLIGTKNKDIMEKFNISYSTLNKYKKQFINQNKLITKVKND